MPKFFHKSFKNSNISLFNISQTDGVHDNDDKHPSSKLPETFSEAVKVLKGEYVIKAIEEQNMDQGEWRFFNKNQLRIENIIEITKVTKNEYNNKPKMKIIIIV